MGRRERQVLAAVVVVLVGSGLALALLVGDGEGSADPATLTLERGRSPTGLPEVLGTVSGDAAVGGDATSVGFTCTDADAGVVTTARYAWPLEEDGPEPQPHIHQPASGDELRRIRECRLQTRPALTAELPLR